MCRGSEDPVQFALRQEGEWVRMRVQGRSEERVVSSAARDVFN